MLRISATSASWRKRSEAMGPPVAVRGATRAPGRLSLPPVVPVLLRLSTGVGGSGARKRRVRHDVRRSAGAGGRSGVGGALPDRSETSPPRSAVPPSPTARRLALPRWLDTRLVLGVLLVLVSVLVGARVLSG